MASGKGLQDIGILGVSLFFDPMDFDNETYRKIGDIIENVRSLELSEPHYERIGKLYAMTIASAVPSELTKEEFFKQIVDIFYNPARAIMNLHSDVPLIRFISNVVVQVGGM